MAGKDEWAVVEPEGECLCKATPRRFGGGNSENLGVPCCAIP